jgi:hypothetical protein
MTAIWVCVAVVAIGYAVSRITVAPAARGKSISTRFEEARQLVSSPEPANVRPCSTAREIRRSARPLSYVAHCNSGAALNVQEPPRR